MVEHMQLVGIEEHAALDIADEGVVGFDGPPDPMDDGVDDGGPLPPGSPASPY